MRGDQPSAGTSDLPPEQQPLIIENVEILEIDNR